MKLFAIINVRDRLGKISGQNLSDAPGIVECVEIDEKFVVGGMVYLPFQLCRCLSVLNTIGFANCVTTSPAFTIMLSIENEQHVLINCSEE